MSWKTDLNAKFTQGSILHAADLNELVNAVPMAPKAGGVSPYIMQVIHYTGEQNAIVTVGGDASSYSLIEVTTATNTVNNHVSGIYSATTDSTTFNTLWAQEFASTTSLQISATPGTIGQAPPVALVQIQLIVAFNGIELSNLPTNNVAIQNLDKGGIGLQTASGDNAMFIRLKNYEEYDLSGMHLGFMTKNRRRGTISQTSRHGSVNRWTLSTAMNRDGTGTPISGRKQWIRAINQSWYDLPEDLNSWLGIDFSQFISAGHISDVTSHTKISQPAGQTIGSLVEVAGLTSKFVYNNTSSQSKLIYMNIPTKLVLYKYKQQGDNRPYDVYAEHDGVLKLEFTVTFGMGGVVSSAVWNGKVRFAPK